jgi:hypothetical protein
LDDHVAHARFAVMLTARDALSADYEAIASPTKVNR